MRQQRPASGEVIEEDARIAELRATYLAMGSERSMRELSAITGVAAPVLGRYRKAGQWDQAARDYDLEIVRRAMESDKAEKAAQWRKRQDEQLKVAMLLRRKAVDYLINREVEAVEDEKGRTVVPGMDPMKASWVLQALKSANETEQRILGVTELMLEGVHGLVISPELLQLQIQKAIQLQAAWRQDRDLPALAATGMTDDTGPSPDDDVLGEYAL